MCTDPLNDPRGGKEAQFSTIKGNINDSLTMCWEFPPRLGIGWKYDFEVGKNTKSQDTQSRVYSAVTGIKTSKEELDKVGERMTTQFRALLIRNYDRGAQMEWNEFVPKLRIANIDEGKFASTVANFYDLWGWDRKTGWPTRDTLESLDLKDVADELHKLGKLPEGQRSAPAKRA
jgi:aldehyde:ferredoxin oxidoreductase